MSKYKFRFKNTPNKNGDQRQHVHILIILKLLYLSTVMNDSRPLKDAVAATAEHIAGLLPSHFTYSEAHSSGDQVCVMNPLYLADNYD